MRLLANAMERQHFPSKDFRGVPGSKVKAKAKAKAKSKSGEDKVKGFEEMRLEYCQPLNS